MNTQNLEKNLKAGKHVIVHDESKKYLIISPFKVENGNYRYSGCWSSLQKAVECIGCFSGINIFEDLKDYTFIGFYEPEFEPFKAGDKVLISKDAEKWCERVDVWWNFEKENMIGKIYEVKSIDGDKYYIFNEKKSDYWIFPPQTLSYPMEEPEEEDEVEKAIKLLVEKGKLKPGQILI